MPTNEPAGRPWWQEAVFYQIYPRSFQDSNGDGIGDLAGITSRLDYVCDLGVDAIWISPFYPSPMADFGYDVADYCDVDPMFGSLDDFDALLDGAHRRGLRVVIDWVPNHTSDEHPWFVESRSSRESAKRDWYVWVDPAPDGGPPNNWLSLFGGPAWHHDPATGQYYLHSFLREQPDLNWDNPEVEAAMHDTLRFWLDRGVDGFRIDVAHFIAKDPLLRDNPPASTSSGGQDLGPYDSFEHVYDKAYVSVHDRFRAIRAVLDEYDDRFAIGEIHQFDWASWASYYGEGDELHMPFNFALIYAPWDADAYRSIVVNVEASVPPTGWPNYVLGNHDETRLASRLGRNRTRVAAMALLALRGTPTIYYGDEIGLAEQVIGPDERRDPWVRTNGLTRDGCRTPMRWDASEHAGFTDGFAPWLPIGEEVAAINVSAQLDDASSLLALYRSLLELRRRTPALRVGSFAVVGDTPPDVFAFRRDEASDSMLVVLNFSDEPRELVVPASRLVLETSPDSVELRGVECRIAGNAGAIFALEKASIVVG